MAMTNYQKGSRFENDVRAELEEHGYECVRAAGSAGSTKIDLVAFKTGQTLMIQCKSGKKSISGAEWNKLREVAALVGAIPLLVEKVQGQPQYWELTGVHEGKRLPPKAPWSPDFVATMHWVCRRCGSRHACGGATS